jgi:hypothetical protein
MKTAIILLLVLSTLVVGCAQAPEAPSQQVTEPVISDQEAIDEVDDSLLSEDEEIEIGEMI